MAVFGNTLPKGDMFTDENYRGNLLAVLSNDIRKHISSKGVIDYTVTLIENDESVGWLGVNSVQDLCALYNRIKKENWLLSPSFKFVSARVERL